MEEFLSFLKLYVSDDVFLGNSLLIVMLILYGNVGLYLLDFYSVVKRKHTAETVAMMALPVVVSVMGSVFAGLMVQVPNPKHLGKFAAALQSRSLNVSLVLMVVIYLLLWAVTFLSFGTFSFGKFALKKRKQEDVLRWILSGILDYCFAAMILVCSGWCSISGESLFVSGREWLLWLYLYAFYLLGCKTVLLAVALFVRLYSVRITIFKWKEGKNPSAFLFRYFVFYQNAIVRNTLLVELGILIPLTSALNGEGWTYEGVGMMGFLWFCGVFVILFSLSPAMNALYKFRAWGEPRRMRELFCHEYFVEEPLCKIEEYTLTRHFLIDNQSPGTFYYWPFVKSVSGWVTDKKGKTRTIYFLEGTNCTISGEETEGLSPIFEYAKKWQEGNVYPYEKGFAVPGKIDNPYTNFIRTLAIILAFILITLPRLL